MGLSSLAISDAAIYGLLPKSNCRVPATVAVWLVSCAINQILHMRNKLRGLQCQVTYQSSGFLPEAESFHLNPSRDQDSPSFNEPWPSPGSPATYRMISWGNCFLWMECPAGCPTYTTGSMLLSLLIQMVIRNRPHVAAPIRDSQSIGTHQNYKWGFSKFQMTSLHQIYWVWRKDPGACVYFESSIDDSDVLSTCRTSTQHTTLN